MARSQALQRKPGREEAMHTQASVLRERIKAGMAVNVLNKVIKGSLEVSQTRLAAIKLALGKVLPDLQAVAVAIENKTPINKHDVDALLLQAGLRPDMAWQAVDNKRVIDGEHETVPTENNDDEAVWEEAPHPPESGG